MAMVCHRTLGNLAKHVFCDTHGGQTRGQTQALVHGLDCRRNLGALT